jgi:hypothetical protein
MRGVGEACKHIQHPLLHSAKAHCLVSSAMTLHGLENKRLPLRTLTSSRITNHRLPVVLLAPEEREKKESEKVKEKGLGIELT